MKQSIDDLKSLPMITLMENQMKGTAEIYYLKVFYCFMLIPFLLFVFAGKMTDLIEGYGKLLVIRHYSKVKMIVKAIGESAIILAFLLIMMALIAEFSIVSHSSFTFVQFCLVLGMYYNVILSLIILQMILEMFMKMQNATLIVNLFVLGSLLFYHPLSLLTSESIACFLLYPNIAFSQRSMIISHPYLMIIAIFVNVILIIVCSVCFKERDIL